MSWSRQTIERTVHSLSNPCQGWPIGATADDAHERGARRRASCRAARRWQAPAGSVGFAGDLVAAGADKEVQVSADIGAEDRVDIELLPASGRPRDGRDQSR
jgi:hypothetical protein